SHQTEEGIDTEPMLVSLAAKCLQHVPCLTFTRPPINRNKKVRRPEVAVILWYFVLEHQVISKRVPGEIRQHPVILMAVVPIVRQHDVWSVSPLQLFEDFLDVGIVRKKPVSKLSQHDCSPPRAFEEQGGAATCFHFPRTAR